MLSDLDLVNGFNPDDRLLRPRQAAEMLGISPQTLAVWRHRKNKGESAPDLPYRKIGRRSVRYRLSDLKIFVELGKHADATNVAPQSG